MGAAELEDRFAAASALGRAGSVVEAERAFRGLLSEVRGVDAALEARALRSLAVTYGVSGRAYEAWALGDAAADAARRAGDDAQLGMCLGTLCGALYCLELSELMPPLLVELEAVLDRLPEDAIPWGRRELHEAQFAYAYLSERWDEAREHLAAYERALPPPKARDVTDSVVLAMFHARIEQAEGDVESALTRMAALDKEAIERPNVALDVIVRRTEVLQLAGRRAAAMHCAERALGLMESLETQPFSCFDRLDKGRMLVTALERLGAEDLVRRALDIVAAAILEHFAELDGCARLLPEVGLQEGPQAAQVVGARKRFLVEQKRVLRRVAALMEDQPQRFARLLAHEADGYIRICAWCERLRPQDGSWLPIGQYVPRHGPLRITHGICEACAERMA